MNENEPTKELFIATHPNEVHIALLEDKKLVEIRREKTTEHCSVGDIYLAKVRKLIPGLNAAFVDIGLDKEGFLHYLDLGLHGNTINAFVQQAKEKNKKSIVNFPYKPTLPKAGKIGVVLSQGQEILVQVAKEPMSSKGARVTAEISFAGRFLVLIPFSDSVSISQKIKNPEEKKRLKKLVQSIKPKKFGVIIRTVAEGKKVEDITADMEQVTERWKLLVSKLNKAKAPMQISADIDKTSAIIRDMLHESFTNIYVDSPKIYDDLKTYLKSISFQNIQILHL
ncbi:MAG: ribonuclease E/G, partial [Bacteroidales bacterium]|nr:ribonuclease E/G [Bacteroidales bacterium]